MTSTNINGDRLKAAAQAGNIDLLYTVIQDDPSILDEIDSKAFVETPLHIAASLGHIPFAVEIMNLKPSFAKKLNPQGFTPIHLAMQNNEKRMVYRLVSIKQDLVRVKGREGLTPLHFASQIGEVDLLANFLIWYPESIQYMTVKGETALHIAIKNGQFEALQVLVRWLETNEERGAQGLEDKILNWLDVAGNTILHIAALSTEPQALLLLLKSGINLNKKNLENKTALDVASTPEIKSILLKVGAKPSSEVPDAATLPHWLRSETTFKDKTLVVFFRMRNNVTDEQRNIWLIVATLIATTMFESALTPPGGVYQSSAGDSNLNITSSNSTISTKENVGKSVMSEIEFMTYSITSMFSFLISTVVILITTSGVVQVTFLYSLMLWFFICYMVSMLNISPGNVKVITGATPFVFLIILPLVLFAMTYFFIKKRGRRLSPR